MDAHKIQQILIKLHNHRIDVDNALAQLKDLPYADLGFARLDMHRSLRTGSAEVIFCESKTPEQVAAIFERLGQKHDKVMGTRASPEMAHLVQSRLPEIRYDPLSRLLILNTLPAASRGAEQPLVVVAAAGTADLPVAEEAAQTLEFLGDCIARLYDVGVAGIHRLLDQRETLQQADVIISVAGMEGALTSVIAGLVACPVIGVPTSIGYGASFGGLAALLAMLNSCAPGVAVVNIDNGFGAAQMAHTILERVRLHRLDQAPAK
jgi:hypothetical protein